MELNNRKSVWAALATLGVTAVAAGATAIVKFRERRHQRQEKEASGNHQRLTAEQQMVYNEAVAAFRALNKRIYDLRKEREALQPLILWLATDGDRPQLTSDDDNLLRLADDIAAFLTTQMPFINASLSTLADDGTSYVDYVRGAVGGTFDDALDEEPTGVDVANGTPIKFVLRLGYYFPECTLALQPVKSIVTI